MHESPTISVVLGVFNGNAKLRATVESILEQTYSNFEFIIVNDGSTDDTAEQLLDLAGDDARIVVLTQKNAGLTAALKRGCEMARGQFIARQDVGDRSYPQRFERQLALLQAAPNVVAVGAGCRRIGPRSEFLGNTCTDQTPDEVTRSLIENGVSLPHMATTFRAEAYRRVGGYRMQFRYAQDIDLWYRMATIGKLATVNEILFEMSIDATGISALQRCRQAELSRIARQAYFAQKCGESEDKILQLANELSWSSQQTNKRMSETLTIAKSMYFIGSQLLALGDARCRSYFREAARAPRLFPKAVFKIAQSYSRCTDVNVPPDE